MTSTSFWWLQLPRNLLHWSFNVKNCAPFHRETHIITCYGVFKLYRPQYVIGESLCYISLYYHPPTIWNFCPSNEVSVCYHKQDTPQIWQKDFSEKSAAYTSTFSVTSGPGSKSLAIFSCLKNNSFNSDWSPQALQKMKEYEQRLEDINQRQQEQQHQAESQDEASVASSLAVDQGSDGSVSDVPVSVQGPVLTITSHLHCVVWSVMYKAYCFVRYAEWL